jgi:hypothetical protein
MYFVVMYKNRTNKHVEIFLRLVREEKLGRTRDAVEPIKIYGIHKDICKCHNVSSCTTIYTNKILNNK